MKPLVLLGTGNGLERVREMLLAREPELNIVRPDDADAQQAEIALCWNPAPGSLGMYPHLRLIHSIAAGADQIFKDPSRDPQIPVCRIVDPITAWAWSNTCFGACCIITGVLIRFCAIRHGCSGIARHSVRPNRPKSA